MWIVWATTLIPIELGTAIDENLLTEKLISKAWLEAKKKFVINKTCMNLDDIYTHEEMEVELVRTRKELRQKKKELKSNPAINLKKYYNALKK